MVHKCEGCRYKSEHQEMGFRPMGVCNRGANLVEAELNYRAKKCPYKKTNADRIRAMSDEELVAWAHKQIGCGFDYFPCGVVCEGKCEAYSTEACDTKILEWLKQPAEVER